MRTVAPVAFVPRDRAFGDLRQAVLGYDQQRQQAPAPATGWISLLPAEGGADTAFDVTALYIGAWVAEADSMGRRRTWHDFQCFSAPIPASPALMKGDDRGR